MSQKIIKTNEGVDLVRVKDTLFPSSCVPCALRHKPECENSNSCFTGNFWCLRVNRFKKNKCDVYHFELAFPES